MAELQGKRQSVGDRIDDDSGMLSFLVDCIVEKPKRTLENEKENDRVVFEDKNQARSRSAMQSVRRLRYGGKRIQSVHLLNGKNNEISHNSEHFNKKRKNDKKNKKKQRIKRACVSSSLQNKQIEEAERRNKKETRG